MISVNMLKNGVLQYDHETTSDIKNYGIQYLDNKVLTQILLDTEPVLFNNHEIKTAAETPT